MARAGIFTLLIALTSPLAVLAQDEFGGRALNGSPRADEHWLAPPRETLKGISEVAVVIETLKPVAQTAGLSIEVLKNDVEQQLKRSRIKVRDMPTPLMQKTGARSATDIVYVKVGSVRPEGSESIVYSVSVEAKQIVTLDRLRARIRGTTTWESGMLGIVGTDEFVTEVRSDVGEHVGRFINDYLAANR